MTDKTRVPSSSGSVAQVRSVKPNRHARNEPNHFKRHRFNRAVRSGHAPTRPLARCSATPTELPRPGHASWSLPSAHCSPGGAPGISPFAGLLPPTDGLDITAEPGPHAVCVARPSRLIFVGRIDRRVEMRSSGDRSRTFLVTRRQLLGFTPVCDPYPRHRAGERSCLGFCLLQGCGRAAAHSIGLDPDRITSLRKPAAAFMRPRAPIRSWVCGVGLRSPSPSLQRIDGADALPT